MKLLLSAICVALLALFAYQVMSYPLQENNLQKKPLDGDLAKSVNYNLPKLAVLNGIDNYSEIIQRPLFAKDRAANFVAQKVNKVKTVNELSHLILVGTARSTDVQIAIVADTKAKQMERLKAGETYNDWDIAEVSSDHVVFLNNELEYKLFVTPIKGSQKDKRARFLSKYDKSKIERATEAINSYRDDKASSGSEDENNSVADKPKRESSKPWNYGTKAKSANSNDKGIKNKPAKKSAQRSPIKIPGEEERDQAYYEGLGPDEDSLLDSDESGAISEGISAEQFYNDDEISAEELKLLEGLGARIFDD